MKEEDIRPEDLLKGQAESYLRDVRWLLGHKEDFVSTNCPACGGAEHHRAFEKYELTYVECDRCETVFINPRPTPAILENYYRRSENYAYWNKYIFPASEAARREKIFIPRVKRVLEICEKWGVPTRTLMEIGAGFGIFCEEMKKQGRFERIIAVEPTPDLAETCRSKGLVVVEKPVEKVDAGELTVDVIASFEVIEHLFSPRDFIRDCVKLLADGGIFVATCPNMKGFDVIVLKELSSAVDTEHLNYFSPASLSRLVEECGLEVIEVQTPGRLDAELVRKKALSGEFDISNQPFLRQILVEEWERLGEKFQDFLSSNLLSSNMWIVARKAK